ncbi:protein NO VEIN domain-containing protein [Rhodococcus sp. NPDC003383]
MFVSHSGFSDITPTQYEQALEWARELDLLQRSCTPSEAAQHLFDAAISNGETLWFRDLVDLVPTPEDLPDEAIRAAEALQLDLPHAYARISSLAQKVDTEERERIGAAGERELAKLLRSTTHTRIEHVSEWSDGHGYDMAVSTGGMELHIEVKSTNRRGSVRIFLSRHEFEVMKRDPTWRLVVVRLDNDLKVDSIGVVSKSYIEEAAPRDHSALSRWDSARFILPESVVEPGIQELRPYQKDQSPSELLGIVCP